jgi:hypothetical protein
LQYQYSFSKAAATAQAIHPKKGRPWVASHTISAEKPTIAARPAFRRSSGLKGEESGLPLMGWLPVALRSEEKGKEEGRH